MKAYQLFGLTLIASSMTACGTFSDADATTGTSYAFTIPAVGFTEHWAVTITDNQANTINETYTSTVTGSTSTGYTVYQDDPTGNSVVVNGTTYSVTPENVSLNSSGQVLSFVENPNGSDPTTCTYSPYFGGGTYPLKVSQTFSNTTTQVCSAGLPSAAAPLTLTTTGTVEDVESLTIAAGTFSTLKVVSTYTDTNSSGTTLTETDTAWRDVQTGQVVQETKQYSYSGTAPSSNGYAVQSTSVLQSYSS